MRISSLFLRIWSDDVALKRARTPLKLLISKHSFNLNENREFVDEVIHNIGFHGRYACHDYPLKEWRSADIKRNFPRKAGGLGPAKHVGIFLIP